MKKGTILTPLQYKNCIICGASFSNRRKDGGVYGEIQYTKKKCCSFLCSNKLRIGRKLSESHRKRMSEARRKLFANGFVNWCKGKKLSPEHCKKIGLSRQYPRNEEVHNWKGDKVGYAALHTWIQRKLGKPSTCQKCLKSGLSTKKIHWANISGEYKRDFSDWIRLCAICHHKMDKITQRGWITRKSNFKML